MWLKVYHVIRENGTDCENSSTLLAVCPFSFFVVCCLWFVVCGLWFVVLCCMLFVVCCLLFVVCCCRPVCYAAAAPLQLNTSSRVTFMSRLDEKTGLWNAADPFGYSPRGKAWADPRRSTDCTLENSYGCTEVPWIVPWIVPSSESMRWWCVPRCVRRLFS